MACHYEIFPERELAVLTLSGTVTGETFIDGLRAVLADPAWRAGYARLWDGRRITMCVVSPDDAAAILRFLDEQQACTRSCRTAFVAARELDRELFEFFKVMTRELWPIRVFGSMNDAYGWLERWPAGAPCELPVG